MKRDATRRFMSMSRIVKITVDDPLFFNISRVAVSESPKGEAFRSSSQKAVLVLQLGAHANGEKLTKV